MKTKEWREFNTEEIRKASEFWKGNFPHGHEIIGLEKPICHENICKCLVMFADQETAHLKQTIQKLERDLKASESTGNQLADHIQSLSARVSELEEQRAVEFYAMRSDIADKDKEIEELDIMQQQMCETIEQLQSSLLASEAKVKELEEFVKMANDTITSEAGSMKERMESNILLMDKMKSLLTPKN